MILPTIHLNGTSAKALLEQTTVACDDAHNLLKALAEAAPNERDYYPQGDSAFEEARREYEARVEAVRGVLRDMEALAEHCCGALP